MGTYLRIRNTGLLAILPLAAVAVGGCSGASAGSSTETAPQAEARAEARATEPSESTAAEPTAAEPTASEPTDDRRRAQTQTTEEASTAPPEGEEPSAERRELMDAVAGEWRLADGDAEAQIDRAISEVTGQMSFFTRGIATGRIDEAVNPDERVRIEASGAEDVVVAIGEGDPVTLALNGPYVRTTGADGQSLRVRARTTGDRLIIEEVTDQGTRVLAFQPRGDALVMTTRIRSDRLPADIVYGLDYRRTGGGEVAAR